MRIIPVLDLQGGAVVHAVRGERARYAPLRSRLVAGSEPAAVARALLAAAGADELYVADLDALAGRSADLTTLAALAAVARVTADAGATGADAFAALAGAGVHRVVLGTESLGAAGLDDGPPVALSVDLRDGRLVSADRALDGRPVAAAEALAAHPRVAELLVIDLARVGSGEGPPLDAVTAVAGWGRPVLAGGGVRDAGDLRRLRDVGAAGALVATALHSGALSGPPWA